MIPLLGPEKNIEPKIIKAQQKSKNVFKISGLQEGIGAHFTGSQEPQLEHPEHHNREI